MRLRILTLLLFLRVAAGLFIISPNISTAWNLSAPQTITWSTERRDTRAVDIYAVWWKSSNISIGTNSTATNATGSFSQTSIPLAFGVDTSSKLWEGALPPAIPPNSYIRVRMITAGRSVCLTGESCTRFIQAESQEFITFNSNSTVTSLPNGGIRTTVPTPTPNSTKTIPTAFHTITMSFIETITSMPNDQPSSNKTSIIAGVTGSVCGILLGGSVAAFILFFRNRRQKREGQPYTGVQISEPVANPPLPNVEPLPVEPGSPGSAPPRSTFEETESMNTWQTGDRNSTSPELRARWAGGTRYEPVSPEEQTQGARRVATLEFRPRANQGIQFIE